MSKKVDSSAIGFIDKTVPKFDRAEFIKLNAELIVVAETDELGDILKYPDSENVSNDAILLLNSRRLDFADPKAVADIIRKRFAEKNVQSPFDGLSDAEIFENIKSRHIQSMSELDSYSEYLASSLVPYNLDSSKIEEKVDSDSNDKSE